MQTHKNLTTPSARLLTATTIRECTPRGRRCDDSQRSGPLAMTFGDLRVVDRVVASIASLPRLGSDGSMMTRHDDSQRSDRLAVTQPILPRPPPTFSNRETTNRSG